MNTPVCLLTLRGAFGALVLIGTSGLTACAPINPFATAPIDPASPLAAEAAKASRSDRPYPTFAQIPKAPTDLRSSRDMARAAGEVEAAAAQLDADTAPNSFSLSDTDAFAARAARAAGADAAPDADDRARTEAFARTNRDRATPPPPPR